MFLNEMTGSLTVRWERWWDRWDPRLYLSLVSSRPREVLVNNSPRRYLAGFYPTEIYEQIVEGRGGIAFIYIFSIKK